MTREEYIRQASKEDLAQLLCSIAQVSADSAIVGQMDEGKLDNKQVIDVCQYCVASKYCHEGHNGFIDWLDKEAKHNQVEESINIFND